MIEECETLGCWLSALFENPWTRVIGAALIAVALNEWRHGARQKREVEKQRKKSAEKVISELIIQADRLLPHVQAFLKAPPGQTTDVENLDKTRAFIQDDIRKLRDYVPDLSVEAHILLGKITSRADAEEKSWNFEVRRATNGKIKSETVIAAGKHMLEVADTITRAVVIFVDYAYGNEENEPAPQKQLRMGTLAKIDELKNAVPVTQGGKQRPNSSDTSLPNE